MSNRTVGQAHRPRHRVTPRAAVRPVASATGTAYYEIVDIRTIPLAFRAANPVMSARGINAARNALLVEIETDTGLVGLGEAGSAGGPLVSTETVIQQELRPMLLGEDPRMIEALWQKMFARTRQHGRRGLVMHAISGIDIALWDLAGKATGQPLYRLLGGFTDRVEVYASGGFYQRGKDTAALPTRRRATSRGVFRAMKMKVGRTRLPARSCAA